MIAQRTIILLTCLFACSGCFFVNLPTLMSPEARFLVTDGYGQPVAGATVVLATFLRDPSNKNSSNISGEIMRTLRYADDRGIAQFRKQFEHNELRGELLWNFCVEAYGYITFRTYSDKRKRFGERTQVILYPGLSEPCPDDLSRNRIFPRYE